MAVSIEQVVSKIAAWQGKQIEIEPLSGGLTNTNYRVDVDGLAHFVRIPGAKTELLAIDRRNEYHNTKAAAEAGVAPRVLYHLLRESYQGPYYFLIKVYVRKIFSMQLTSLHLLQPV